MGEEADELVQGHAPFDFRGKRGERGHVGVQVCVGEPHHERLVAYQAGGLLVLTVVGSF